MDMDAYDLGTTTVVPVRVNEGDPHLIEVFEANDLIAKLATTENPDEYWGGIRDYVADQVGVKPDSLDFGQLGRFVDLIIKAVECVEEERKKKREQIVSSLQRIRAFRENIFTGTNGQSEHGSTISPTPKPSSKPSTPTITAQQIEDTPQT